MEATLVEALKQDVAKWEEAAKAVEHWLSKVPEADRLQLINAGRQYKANALAIRSLLEQLHRPAE